MSSEGVVVEGVEATSNPAGLVSLLYLDMVRRYPNVIEKPTSWDRAWGWRYIYSLILRYHIKVSKLKPTPN